MRSNVILLIISLCVAGHTFTAHATEVNVVGLADGTAILVIDGGKPRLLRVGQSLAGVKLMSVDNDHAVIEVDGKEREFSLSGNSYAPPKRNTRGSVTLAPNSRGHYLVLGKINGQRVRFMVDTGASMVSMDALHAERAGIDYLAGQKMVASTANGLVEVYLVRLDNVQVGDIILDDVEGIVHADAELPFVLLGMSFLNQLDIRREENNLTLETRN